MSAAGRLSSAPLLLLALLLLPPAAAADYRLEVIVFESLYPLAEGELLADDRRPEPQGGVSLPFFGFPGEEAAPGDASSAPAGYAPLASADYRLYGVFSVLERAPGYRPLLHLAWRQPGHRRSAPLRLPGTGLPCAGVAPPAVPPDAAPAAAAAPAGPAGQSLLAGTVRLRDAGRLFLDLELSYRPCAEASVGGRARLSQSRRILLDRLYYFDHPLLGVLVQVERI
ncbi:MAG: CsiV family protein [Gammaproteobacteria bacterium]|nr:CsiV family protein [Gammaproteobacteria bacterium]